MFLLLSEEPIPTGIGMRIVLTPLPNLSTIPKLGRLHQTSRDRYRRINCGVNSAACHACPRLRHARPPPPPSPLAIRIGGRLKTARLKSGLTQQQLAGDRYTKAYVSALENALIKPSMVALDYLAGRLGTTASRLMADEEPAWNRLDVDLKLAAGDWQRAVDGYAAILETTTDAEQRGRAAARRGRGTDPARPWHRGHYRRKRGR